MHTQPLPFAGSEQSQSDRRLTMLVSRWSPLHGRRKLVSFSWSSLFLFALTLACDSGSEPPPALRVVSITPSANATGIWTTDAVRIVFSGAVDPATVTSASVNVASTSPTSGTLTVDGNTVTFRPADPFREFRTQYAVNVGTGVRSTEGGQLASAYTSAFTTVQFDTAYYYRIQNEQIGNTRALGTFGGTFACFFPPVGNVSGQFWYFVAIPNSQYYLLRNIFQGDSRALEGGTPGQPCLITNRPANAFNFTGQAWEITSSSSGFRFTNQAEGPLMSLDVLMFNGEPMPSMAPTSQSNSQMWTITRIGPRPAFPTPPPRPARDQ